MRKYCKQQCLSHTLLVVMLNMNENFENCSETIATIYQTFKSEPTRFLNISNVASRGNFHCSHYDRELAVTSRVSCDTFTVRASSVSASFSKSVR